MTEHNTPVTETVLLSTIQPYEHNPRDNADAIDAVAESIKNYGFLVPIVVDGEGVIVAGHTRYAASEKLGLEEVPIIRADHLTEEQTKAFRLIDNRTAELATWDFDMLADEISALTESGVDLVPFGWTSEEIDCLSQMVVDDCMAEAPDVDPLARREEGDGVNSAAQPNRRSSAVSRDPKSVRVAVGEINFFVDIEEYRDWAHEVRKANGHDMARITDDLAQRLGLTARPMRRTLQQVKRDEEAAEKDAEAAANKTPKRKRPAKAEPVGEPTKEKVTRPARRRKPKTQESALRDAVEEAEK